MLGLAHHHDGDDLVIVDGWEAMLDGLGFTIKGKAPMRIEDAESVFQNRIAELRNAAVVLEKENRRKVSWNKNAQRSKLLLKPMLDRED